MPNDGYMSMRDLDDVERENELRDQGYMDAAAVPVPDAGDDTLREQLVDLLVMSPLSDTAGTDLTPFRRTADALLPRIREHIAAAVQAERWWICTDALAHGGKKLLGPFQSRDLALEVRVYYEAANEPTTYWVDREETEHG